MAMQRAVQALIRAGNLAKNAVADAIDPNLLAADAERTLYEAYLRARRAITALLAERNYAGVLGVMADMADPLDAFFNQVMVMVDDAAVKNNRLALLKAIAALPSALADLTKITAI